MKILNKIAALFSKKTTAQEHETIVEQTTYPQNNKPQDQACAVYEKGTLEYPAFIPQPLLSFYVMQKALKNRDAACGNISMVKALSLFHPQTSAFICTVFAVKDEEGWYWAKIGTQQVFFSRPEAFIYKPAEKFRIRLKQKDSTTNYVAVCEYKREQVRVTAILEEILTPPTDGDRERFVEYGNFPCSLDEAVKFVDSL